MLGILIILVYIILAGIIVLLLQKNRGYRERISGRVAAPILNIDDLKKHGGEVALGHSVSKRARSCARLLPRLEYNYRQIIKAYKELMEYMGHGDYMMPAAEWLFDNYYVVEEQVKESRANFPRGRKSLLPCLRSGLLKGFPRIYDIALELVSHTDGRIDERVICDYIMSYQSKTQLDSVELWSLSIMLKSALIENIRHICSQVLESQRQHARADMLADMVLARENEENAVLAIRSFIRDMDGVSPAFAEQLIKRLRRHGTELGYILDYMDELLASQNTTVSDIIRQEHQQQARMQMSVGNSITSLRLVSSLDWNNIFETLSPVEQVLRKDPAAIYGLMDFASRDYYRHIVEDMARSLKISEARVAEKAVECAQKINDLQDEVKRHVGCYLSGDGRHKLESLLGYNPGLSRRVTLFIKKHPGPVYLLSMVSLTLAVMLVLMIYGFRGPSGIAIPLLAGFVSLLPASEISSGIVNWLVTHMLPPSFFPKLELKEGIPKECSSMVVIPALLPSKSRAQELLDELEVYYLANRHENLYFALLGDFTDAPDRDMPDDRPIIEYTMECIAMLNHKYSKDGCDIFFFFHRSRRFNQCQGVWMGWERKRGKLMEFNRLSRGLESSYDIKSSDTLPEVKYIITLDADTGLPMGAAKRLIGTMCHPLNRAVMDDDCTKVIRGYGVLQPRVSIGVTNANKSRFSRIFAGQGGIDPYTTAVSDIYQDLFGEGIYTGKGIYDIDVFLKTMDGIIPENTVLSHDLLEGAYARAGLVTDIELVDGFPSKYSSYSARMHRWVRGDWQLLPWLSSRVKNSSGVYVGNPLSAINKWKIIDNIRRSLIPISVIVLLFLAFSLLRHNSLAWLVLGGVTTAFPIIADLASALLIKSRDRAKQYGVAEGIRSALYQILLMFIFLPYRSYMMADAIIRTLFRVAVSKHNLLEWETAQDAEARLGNGIKSYAARMWFSFAASALLVIVAVRFAPDIYYAAVFICLLWLISPVAAYWVSRQEISDKRLLADGSIKELRLLFRKTWRYFEEFAGPEDNYLAPDNYQMDPENGIAHRTSPTNIGMGIISLLAARDMGHINTSRMIDSLEHTFSSMDRLDTWKGHFYNWYDTRTLQPLRPLYVSTVDSGNLAGYLMTLKEGIREYMDRPLIGSELAEGLLDTIELLKQDSEYGGYELPNLEFIKASVEDPVKWCSSLDTISDIIHDINVSHSPYAIKLYDTISGFKSEILELMPWIYASANMPEPLKDMAGADIERLMERLRRARSLSVLPGAYKEAMAELNDIISSVPDSLDMERKWLRDFKQCVMNGYLAANRALGRCSILVEKCSSIVSNMDFKPLFDERRQLFSIGYNGEDEQLNRSYYDLLASEARQASFIAIAKGDVDQKHWFRLGRSVTFLGRHRGLVSWSGTMFEYLMPLLIMRNYKNTLMDSTYGFMLESQISYGRMRNVPWGVSESGFYGFDAGLNYQYRAFGVPRLGLKRGLVNDIVVAPYATIMALMLDPAAAVKNMEALRSEGLEGPYGFFEAADYTPGRIPAGRGKMVVKSFMVHHHGMSLLALDNVINNNIMQQRFHRSPYVKAAELLLQEKVPGRVLLTKDIEEEITPVDRAKARDREYTREIKSPISDFPEAHIISNGSLYSVLTGTGLGYSSFKDMAVTRWREDLSLGSHGIFIYIMNVNSNNMWSAAYEPCRDIPEDYRAVFSSDKVEYFRVDGSIDTHTEVVVSPEDNTEIRRVSLTNHSGHTRVLEVTSYMEVVLSSQSDDVAHPVFNNLFVRTEFVDEYGCLVAARRPRTSDQRPVWLMHSMNVEGEAVGGLQYETDRMKFIGRNRDVSNPAAMDADHPLSNTSGAVLDPVMSLRRRICLHAGETARISYMTSIGDTREAVLHTAQKYSITSQVDRAFELAWTRGMVECGYQNIDRRDIDIYQKMLSHMLYISPNRRMRKDIISGNTRGQSGLWQYGISGDVPILLVSVGKIDELDLVHQMLKAHEYWRGRGFSTDLVILNEDPGNYMQDLYNRINSLILSGRGADIQGRMGGVFLLQGSSLINEGRNLLLSAARIVLRGDGGSVLAQLKARADEPVPLPGPLHACSRYMYEAVEQEDINLRFFNGLGGFTTDGREYVMELGRDKNTPAPWVNIVCNENFGFLVSESGSGYIWAENSRENKLTPWSNDPVTNPPGEVIYFRDDEDCSIWNAAPLPVIEDSPYLIKHGFGYSVFEHTSHGIKHEITMFVPEHDNIKVMKIRLRNISGRDRKISCVYYVRPVLGVSDQITAPFIVTGVDQKSGVLFASNTFSDDFPGRVMFVDCSIEARSVTGDRNEFLGYVGSMKEPAALKRQDLSGRVGAGYDPCCAMKAEMGLKAGEERIVVFTLGEYSSTEDAVSTALRYRDLCQVERALGRVRGYWADKLGTVQVDTPDGSLNIMANGWLMYQTICCRIFARSAFYQAGGAYGFRDQLQDVMAASYLSPDLTRRQLIINSAHQFLEGDVQHWWHPVTDRGIRTKFSDDLLWLPYVAADYIHVTKDEGILDEVVRYLEDEPLGESEDERYNKPRVSTVSGSVYQHCIKAIDRSLKFGVHGIPLMGSGDWNDGMNTVGNKGRGESIWLGWFLYSILLKFEKICRRRGDEAKAVEYVKAAQSILDSIEKNGWDGSWYRRAYFDDGTPLGSAANSECRIDSLAQSWSIISGGGRAKRSQEAMGALEQYLVNRDAGLVMLLTPPFDKSGLEPGYIKGYVPGVRENGGQYTHAAVWVVMAYAMMGSGDRAWEIFNMINPVNHSLTPMECLRYKVEPYVMAADVYAVEPHTGRGGWTWYTGAAGWMYRVCIEYMLGLKLHGSNMEIQPCIPVKWKEYTIRYRYMDTVYYIYVKNPSGVSTGVIELRLDGKMIDEAVPLVNDRKEHRVEVVMG